jgi:formylmethanofuran dehydrogenase subunit E
MAEENVRVSNMANIDIEGVKRFHGHWCPGLATGIRVAQVALREIGLHSQDEEIVAVVEADNCAVDAIQYLTGCTFGKGNLIHRDHGKNAFTFVRRSDGRAVRVASNPNQTSSREPELAEAQARVDQGIATAEDHAALRQARIQSVLEAPEEELLVVERFTMEPPEAARIHRSIVCAACGEKTMETRVRILDGEMLCLPCFQERSRRA